MIGDLDKMRNYLLRHSGEQRDKRKSKLIKAVTNNLEKFGVTTINEIYYNVHLDILQNPPIIDLVILLNGRRPYTIQTEVCNSPEEAKMKIDRPLERARGFFVERFKSLPISLGVYGHSGTILGHYFITPDFSEIPMIS